MITFKQLLTVLANVSFLCVACGDVAHEATEKKRTEEVVTSVNFDAPPHS